VGIKKINIEKVGAFIEAGAGEPLPDLRQALAEAKAGLGLGRGFGTTPEHPCASSGREVGTDSGSVCPEHRNARRELARLGTRTICAAGPGGVPAAADIKHPELTRALSATRIRRVDGDKEVSCSAVRCSLQRNSSRSSSLKAGSAQLTFLSRGAVAFQRFFGARCQF